MIKGGKVPRKTKYEVALKDQVDRLRKENTKLDAELSQCLTVHAKLNDECERLKAELAEALDNAPTKQQVRDTFESDAIEAWKDACERLKAERDKLREALDRVPPCYGGNG